MENRKVERPSQKLFHISLTRKEIERLMSWYDHSLHGDEMDDSLAARIATLEVSE